MSVNQAHSVTKENSQNLVSTKFTHETKKVGMKTSVNRAHLVDEGKSIMGSVYWVELANKGFSCFGILSSINLLVGFSRLRRWILSILSCIQVDLTMHKI